MALEDPLEVWHPSMLSKEYKEMPPMLKYVTDQVSARLLRMNKLVVHLTTQEQGRREATVRQSPWASQRSYYRKEVDLNCDYRPVGVMSKVSLLGRIMDMSLSGLGMEIVAENTTNFSHMEGDSFVVNTVLPNGRSVELEAKIVKLRKSEMPGKLLLGMSLTRLSASARKLLGFFLMP